MATGIVIVLLALFIFLRTVAGRPRLVNFILKGKKAAVAAGGNG